MQLAPAGASGLQCGKCRGGGGLGVCGIGGEWLAAGTATGWLGYLLGAGGGIRSALALQMQLADLGASASCIAAQAV